IISAATSVLSISSSLSFEVPALTIKFACRYSYNSAVFASIGAIQYDVYQVTEAFVTDNGPYVTEITETSLPEYEDIKIARLRELAANKLVRETGTTCMHQRICTKFSDIAEEMFCLLRGTRRRQL